MTVDAALVINYSLNGLPGIRNMGLVKQPRRSSNPVLPYLSCRRATFEEDNGDDEDERYVRVASVSGIRGYGQGGYNSIGHGYHSYGGYPSSYEHSSFGGASHYTNVILIKGDDSKGDSKGFFKSLKGLGKGFSKGVSKFLEKKKAFIGLDDKYEFVGALRPKQFTGYGDNEGYVDGYYGSVGGGNDHDRYVRPY